ncbi:MAG: hypothetical protein Q9227_006092 [Pyrenula ochraceoflavens]
MAATTTPPPIQAPTAKEKKYDRQLRLWAASGQRALEESHVLLVVSQTGSGSSVAGVETLKNLVLPSIGQFTILDCATVSDSDLGINFFLEASSLGKSRGEECVRLLKELNPDVKGHAVTQVSNLIIYQTRLTRSQKLEDWLQPDCLSPFNLVLLCGPVPDAGWQICDYAKDKQIPLVYVYSLGFYSTFSVQLPDDFPIVDTHPEPESTQDLRILAPWPDLLALVPDEIESLSDHDYGHVPYIILLLYYLRRWKDTHQNNPPSNFKEKVQFRDLINSAARRTSGDGSENFDEAAAAVLKTLNPSELPSSLKEVFARSAKPPSKSSFWIIASAVSTFYQKHSALPLPGSLPDMKARSADYIRLQNIYKSKARADVAEIASTVHASQSGKDILTAEIEAFCKNAAHIKVLDGLPLPDIRSKPTAQRVLNALATLPQPPENDEDDDEEPIPQDPNFISLIPIFLAFLATEFNSTGKDLISQLIKAVGSTDTTTPSTYAAAEKAIDDAIAELKRSDGGELHNISALTGGMVAQEAIKIITRQYVPVDGTAIFDGVKSRVETLKL